jgi:hypothetical protein
MQAESSISKITARLTQAAKRNCFVLSMGNQDNLPKNASQIFPQKERGKESVLQTAGNGKIKQHLYRSCSSKHPSSGDLATDGSHGNNIHRKLPERAVSNIVTVINHEILHPNQINNLHHRHCVPIISL